MFPFLYRSLPVFLAFATFAVAAKEEGPVADALTQQLLRRPEFEQVKISPDGKLLAIAHRTSDRTIVTISDRLTMKVLRKLDPRPRAEVDTLKWLDDERLLVGTNYVNGMYGIAFGNPTLYVVRVDGTEALQLPANFVSTIDGDADHILVETCGHYTNDGCVTEIHIALSRKLNRPDVLLVAAPDVYASMLTDRKGKVHFAMAEEKDGKSKTWIRSLDDKSWVLINDEKETDLDMTPAGISADGSAGFLISERKTGTNVVEQLDFATGKRTELFRDPVSDPLEILYSVVGKEPIGAVYNATRPEPKFWNEGHSDARILLGLQKAFPGKLARLVNASRDGNLIVVYTESDRDPGSFYVLDRQAKTAELIVQRFPWLKSEDLGATREITLSARDGLPLHGLLTVPPGSTGKNLPLVVLPHGGPFEIVDRLDFEGEVQILATHGYAVLQVNFRGSSGYGKDFVERGMRQWGKAMQDDLTDATHWAVAQGIADPSRMCIYGGSYGGYAALMGAIREPSLYRCAVGYAGVYDLNKLYKWSDARRSDLGLDFLHRWVGTDAVDLAAHSPAQQADKFKIPLLLAHGDVDGVVDIKFAREMNKALKKNKQPSELIVYPYMGHGLLLDAQRSDFYARLLAFLQSNTSPVAASTAVTTPATTH